MRIENSFLQSKWNIWLSKKRIKGLVGFGNDTKMIMLLTRLESLIYKSTWDLKYTFKTFYNYKKKKAFMILDK